jgi:hypothetical protein
LDDTTATVENVIYYLITGIIEEKHENIQKYLPLIVQDVLKTKWTNKEFEQAIGRLI